MSNLPKFSSNKKYWIVLNKLVFGESCQCPGCSKALQVCYVRKYLWCRVCRLKYRATAYKGSWLYGMKLTPKQLFILLWCWQQKKSPDTARLLARVSYPHEAHNHSVGDYANTNQAEGIWSSMKRYLRKLYGNVPTKHLGLICQEWMARQNQPGWFASPENFLRVTLVPC